MKTINFTTKKHLSFVEERIVFMGEKDPHGSDKSDANLRENQGGSKEKIDPKEFDQVKNGITGQIGGEIKSNLNKEPAFKKYKKIEIEKKNPEPKINPKKEKINPAKDDITKLARYINYNSVNEPKELIDIKAKEGFINQLEEKSFTEDLENIPPIAVISGPNTMQVNTKILLDSLYSGIPSGDTITSWQWKNISGDCIEFIESANKPTITIKANKAGFGIVKLKVCDKNGNWSDWTEKKITILDPKIVAPDPDVQSKGSVVKSQLSHLQKSGETYSYAEAIGIDLEE